MTFTFTTFAHLPAVRAAAAPHAPAVADDALDLDNAAFDDAVRRAAAALRAAGVGPGDVVAVKLPNTALLVITLFASWHLGAAATPINPYLAPPEVDYQVQDAGATVLVTDAGAPVGVPVIAADALLAQAPDTAEPAAAPSDLALLIYTSGTTGRPKGVMLDHANLVAMSEISSAAFEFDADDHSLLILPLFHVNAIVVSTLNPLRGGGRVTIAGRFDPRTFFDVLSETGATYFSAVPTIYTMLAGLPAEVRPDLSKVRFGVCGAAPASRELLEGFEARFGFPLIEGYGLSECTCAATCNPLDGVRKVGSVGVALPGQRVRIVGPDGADVPVGEPGEVLLAGPNIMRGYLGRPEETAKTVVDGWLHTGDVGILDEDGYLRLVDRAKDMIIRGGENIYPKEIETAVYGVSGVAEAAAIGRPDAKYGELPVLYVSAAPGVRLDVDAIAAHARAQLAKYKQPVAITVLDALPKNPVGKIDKPSLRRLDAAAPTA
ncbi:class I adenylate-forming enzyme family protein [Tsukamurella ocularis]|uniref:class I adenylate-forming enzyme family protein n=1 Tax=Tsukamurella ocularis TaxID=1970234 RepID=UPI00216703F6|nr:AMP-binding protein [Tsukamurella ocularis]MCS3781920.1 acyl-CoA synthetase (AMP-forming)/AMP-acid ligase II [Tsukamurella ocularis]MCS3788414.1 acyl-CoA synthetase (AMP-forming)/AMP-acid ligase II [Tsukamurella ocularis]MCS3852134.1 acyl-CoA synthetase (AMP-forming)/AMP-acid ligase II [Tsukamurella ocularis]